MHNKASVCFAWEHTLSGERDGRSGGWVPAHCAALGGWEWVHHNASTTRSHGTTSACRQNNPTNPGLGRVQCTHIVHRWNPLAMLHTNENNTGPQTRTIAFKRPDWAVERVWSMTTSRQVEFDSNGLMGIRLTPKPQGACPSGRELQQHHAR